MVNMDRPGLNLDRIDAIHNMHRGMSWLSHKICLSTLATPMPRASFRSLISCILRSRSRWAIWRVLTEKSTLRLRRLSSCLKNTWPRTKRNRSEQLGDALEIPLSF